MLHTLTTVWRLRSVLRILLKDWPPQTCKTRKKSIYWLGLNHMQVLVTKQYGPRNVRVRELCWFVHVFYLTSSPVGGVVKGTGVGTSKAEAKQAAAQEALTVGDKNCIFSLVMLNSVKALRSAQWVAFMKALQSALIPVSPCTIQLYAHLGPLYTSWWGLLLLMTFFATFTVPSLSSYISDSNNFFSVQVDSFPFEVIDTPPSSLPCGFSGARGLWMKQSYTK